MGIIDNVLAGAAKGFIDFGTAYAREGMQEAADARTMERQRMMQREQLALMEERDKRMAEFKIELAEKVRDREMNRLKQAVGDVAGISGQFDKARDAYANSSGYYEDESGNRVPIGDVSADIDSAEQGAIAKAMGNKNILKAAANSVGDFDLAKSLGDEKLHNVAPGQVVIDESGKKVFDNTDSMIQKIKEQGLINKERDSSKASLKVADPVKASETITKLDKGAREATDEVFKERRHPFATDDEQKAPDKAMHNVVKEYATQLKRNAVSKNKMMSDYEAAEMVTEKVEEMDVINREVVNAAKSALFNEKGELKNKALAEKLKGTGVSFESPESFAKTFRDSMMTKDDFRRFRTENEAYVSEKRRLIESMKVTKPAKTGAKSGIIKGAQDRPALTDPNPHTFMQ